MAPPRGLAWLWAIILLGGAVPLALLVAAGVSLYNQAINEADLRVERSARIGEEQALKVFQTNIALLNRVLDALGDDADEPLLAREAPLHQQLRRMSADLMQLQGIFVIGASGRMLATDRVLPAPHGIDFSDRPFFVHHRQGGAQPFISQVLTSRTTGEPFFDMSVRRSTRSAGFAGSWHSGAGSRWRPRSSTSANWCWGLRTWCAARLATPSRSRPSCPAGCGPPLWTRPRSRTRSSTWR